MANDPNVADHAAPEAVQVARPWQRTARTIVQGVVGVAIVWPSVVVAAGVDSGGAVAAGSITVAAGISRVMALPAVNAWLARFVPFLAA